MQRALIHFLVLLAFLAYMVLGLLSIMGTVKVLPDHVVAKIAAGEVVERPASVVKELVDNAVDAGATSVEIHIAGGGKKSINVIDNGSGMDGEDARACVERHATSKISTDQDLFNIRTMGFRGEALAAIAAISKLVIETKTSNSNVVEGALVSVEGGVVREVRATGCPSGTRISVSNLFYNVPARKKFLKSDSVEFGYIADVIRSLALANGNIRFELSHGGKKIIGCHRAGDVKNRIEDILGDEVRSSLFEFQEEGDGIKLHGFVVKDNIARSTAKDLHFFVNGRPVKDRILQHALMKGFEGYLTRGQYPVAVLYLQIDPAVVDVNVHPTKREVKFANSSMVHDFVEASVRKAVACGGAASRASSMICDFARMGSVGGSIVPSLCKGGAGRVDLPPLTPPYKGGVGLYPSPLMGECALRLLGQLDNSFIVCEGEEGRLVLIDQHAAHERLGFEMLKEQLAKGTIEQQRLLLPEQLKFSPKELAIILEHSGIIQKAGFEMEPFGGDSVIVKSVPSILGDVSLQFIFEKISSELADFGSSKATDEEIEKILSVIACHRQVRAGDALTNEEMQSLVRDTLRTGTSHCPHGRPAIVTIERKEVEKWFKRT